MKAISKLNGLKARMAFIVAIILLSLMVSSCGPKPNDGPSNNNKPVVTLKDASSVTLTTAVLNATLVPYETGTTVAFEFCESASSNWQTQTVPLSITKEGINSNIDFTFNFSGLKPATEYKFRVKALNSAGQSVNNDEKKFTTYAVMDYDGNMYHSIVIGNQTWLVENFRVVHYLNGDPINYSTDMNVWGNASTGNYCWPNNDSEVGKTFGAIYSGNAVTDPRGIAPVGYHIPTDSEWYELEKFVGQGFTSGTKLIAISPAWGSITATNETKFSAMPNGEVDCDVVGAPYTLRSFGEKATFWSSNVMGSLISAPYITKQFHALNVGGYFYRQHGAGLRLIKNK